VKGRRVGVAWRRKECSAVAGSDESSRMKLVALPAPAAMSHVTYE